MNQINLCRNQYLCALDGISGQAGATPHCVARRKVAGMYADGEVGLSTTARNFKGRMGSSKAHVYLGSPYSVAAGAVKGYICDPRELLAETA